MVLAIINFFALAFQNLLHGRLFAGHLFILMLKKFFRLYPHLVLLSKFSILAFVFFVIHGQQPFERFVRMVCNQLLHIEFPRLEAVTHFL